MPYPTLAALTAAFFALGATQVAPALQTPRSYRIYGTEEAKPAPGSIAEAMWLGNAWLATHQESDGSWDLQDVHAPVADPSGVPPAGKEQETYRGDVTATSLALLSLAARGHTMSRGRHRAAVARGVKWLIAQQDRRSGLIGEGPLLDSKHAHLIATLVFCELYRIDKSIILKTKAEKALGHMLSEREAMGALEGESNPKSDLASWSTGWALLALRSAKSAGLKLNEGPPVDHAALIARHLLDPKEAGKGVMKPYAAQMLSRLQASEHKGTLDLGYLFHGTFIINREKDKPRAQWNGAVELLLRAAQIRLNEQEAYWGATGSQHSPSASRCGATALAVLCLAAPRDDCWILR